MRNILLIDDHPLVRQGIARVLATKIAGLEVTEAATADAALALAPTRPWDAITLDLSLPDKDGIEVLRLLRKAMPMVPVLIISMHPADQFARRALHAGAAGYVAKTSDPADIVCAVITVMKGGRYLPANVQDGLSRATAAPHEALSDREYQIMRLIGQGRTVTEIATQLSLSVKTVSTYRSRVLEKMHLRTTAEIIRYVMLHSLA